MEIFTAQAAKNQFGDLLMKAQREPVEISKHGKRVAVVMSAEEFAQFEDIKLQLLRIKLANSVAQSRAGQVHDGNTVFNDLMKDL